MKCPICDKEIVRVKVTRNYHRYQCGSHYNLETSPISLNIKYSEQFVYLDNIEITRYYKTDNKSSWVFQKNGFDTVVHMEHEEFRSKFHAFRPKHIKKIINYLEIVEVFQ